MVKRAKFCYEHRYEDQCPVCEKIESANAKPFWVLVMVQKFGRFCTKLLAGLPGRREV